MTMNKIREKVMAEPPESGARQIGEVALMIAGASKQAAEIIAADLDNPDMGLGKCFDALREHASKHQKGGFWGCMCNQFEQANPVIQVVCDFYKVNLDEVQREGALGCKIPKEAFAEQKPKRMGLASAAAAEGAGGIDLLDLL